jgi:small conductance mechanosensitive channel
MEKYIGWGTDWGIKLLIAVVIFIVGKWVARKLADFGRAMLDKQGVDPMVGGFVTNIAYSAMLLFVIIAALGKVGIETTGFVAILGAAGLAIGFALQDSLGNFASGFMIIIFKPFSAGDYVEIAGTAGTVQKIELFTTTLKSPDNRIIIIPNGGITGGNIVNYTATGTRRVDMVFGCGYDDNLQQVKELLEQMVGEDDRILAEPAPTIGVSELGDNSVNFVVRPWTNTSDYWAVHFDFHQRVKERFDAAGFSIPYPQRDVHIHKHDGEADAES